MRERERERERDEAFNAVLLLYTYSLLYPFGMNASLKAYIIM